MVEILIFLLNWHTKTEPNEKLEFELIDIAKGKAYCKFKSRENEMKTKSKNVANEVFKCDLCTKFKTRKGKIK